MSELLKKENVDIESLELLSGILVRQLCSSIKIRIEFCELS
jgi:hypothetical protein